MKITEELLLERGFQKREYYGNLYYVRENFGIVQNVKWIPCNIDTAKPLSTGIYIETIEELEELMSEGGY